MAVQRYPYQGSRTAQIQRHPIDKVLTANGLDAAPQLDLEPQIAPSFHYGTVVPECTIPRYSCKLNLDNMVLLTNDMVQKAALGNLIDRNL